MELKEIKQKKERKKGISPWLILAVFQFFLVFNAQGQVINGPVESENKTTKTELTPDSSYTLTLRFQSIWKDFAVFYDDQKIYYLRYRKDRWDYDNDEKIKEFVQGIQYVVTFKFVKKINRKEELLKKRLPALQEQDLPDPTHTIRPKKLVFYGLYESHKQYFTDSLRY